MQPTDTEPNPASPSPEDGDVDTVATKPVETAAESADLTSADSPADDGDAVARDEKAGDPPDAASPTTEAASVTAIPSVTGASASTEAVSTADASAAATVSSDEGAAVGTAEKGAAVTAGEGAAETASGADTVAAAEEERSGDQAGAASKRGRSIVGAGLTVLACLLVFGFLIYPNVLSRLTPVGFARIPVEGAVLVGIFAVVPRRIRIPVGVVAGVLLGWLVIEKCLDMGFFDELNRPFDPVLDWVLFDDAYSFVVDSYGKFAAVGAVVAIFALVAAILGLSTWAILRVGRLVGQNRKKSGLAAAVIAAAWAVAASVNLTLPGQVPVAARSSYTYAYDRATQARAGLQDASAFAREVQNDAFKNTPADQMLTALRGKDVIFTFVESYGRSAVEAPGLGPEIDQLLDDGTKTLTDAGFASRSGWLTSPTFGGGSWLAHSTLESGLWITNEQRYRDLVSSNRLTMTSAFKKIGVHTVSVMPGATRAWPEGKFYGYDTVWDSRNLGYVGPKFSWAPVPDQYTLKQLNTIEYKKPGRGPLMVEMPLVSSHTPWAPIPTYLPDWNQVNDGTVYAPMAADGNKPGALWQDKKQVRDEYGKSIEYTLTSLINWIRLYGDPNLVLVFLGDHQASPIVSGDNASHDVPISIVAKDPAVLNRITSWGWEDGLRPSTKAPVWPMSDFRDKFFTAFGSTPTP